VLVPVEHAYLIIGQAPVPLALEKPGPGVIVMLNAWLGFPFVSVTETVKLYKPAAVGLPLMTPVEELSDKPGGSEPEEMLNVGAEH